MNERPAETLAARVEALLAKPYPTTRDVESFCSQVRLQGYRSVVIPSSLVEFCYELVADEDIKVCCLVGYPFGQSHPDAKRYEVELAVDSLAHEIELVPTIASFMNGQHAAVLREIRDVVQGADGRPVRVNIESSLLNPKDLAQAVEIVLDFGAQYISTNVAPPLKGPVTEADVVALREVIGASFGLKVGGLKSLETADELAAAGADRLGLLL